MLYLIYVTSNQGIENSPQKSINLHFVPLNSSDINLQKKLINEMSIIKEQLKKCTIIRQYRRKDLNVFYNAEDNNTIITLHSRVLTYEQLHGIFLGEQHDSMKQFFSELQEATLIKHLVRYRLFFSIDPTTNRFIGTLVNGFSGQPIESKENIASDFKNLLDKNPIDKLKNIVIEAKGTQLNFKSVPADSFFDVFNLLRTDVLQAKLLECGIAPDYTVPDSFTLHYPINKVKAIAIQKQFSIAAKRKNIKCITNLIDNDNKCEIEIIVTIIPAETPERLAYQAHIIIADLSNINLQSSDKIIKRLLQGEKETLPLISDISNDSKEVDMLSATGLPPETNIISPYDGSSAQLSTLQQSTSHASTITDPHREMSLWLEKNNLTLPSLTTDTSDFTFEKVKEEYQALICPPKIKPSKLNWTDIFFEHDSIDIIRNEIRSIQLYLVTKAISPQASMQTLSLDNRNGLIQILNSLQEKIIALPDNKDKMQALINLYEILVNHIQDEIFLTYVQKKVAELISSREKHISAVAAAKTNNVIIDGTSPIHLSASTSTRPQPMTLVSTNSNSASSAPKLRKP